MKAQCLCRRRGVSICDTLQQLLAHTAAAIDPRNMNTKHGCPLLVVVQRCPLRLALCTPTAKMY